MTLRTTHSLCSPILSSNGPVTSVTAPELTVLPSIIRTVDFLLLLTLGILCLAANSWSIKQADAPESIKVLKMFIYRLLLTIVDCTERAGVVSGGSAVEGEGCKLVLIPSTVGELACLKRRDAFLGSYGPCVLLPHNKSTGLV